MTSAEAGSAGSGAGGFAERIREITLRLVAWPSVTGSSDEAAFGPLLLEFLAELPCFRDRTDRLRLIPATGLPGCSSVAALVRGRGRRTLVLAGHFDTVGIENYGALAPLACDPLSLREALRAELAGTETDAERLAAQDLAGEDFLPGRGILDMKSGIAAGIAVLEAFAKNGVADGNLLLIATPDEENRSRGMRSVRDALPALARDWDLDIVGAINLDATSDLHDGSAGRAIFLGSVGKLLPFAYVVGRPAHAGYPFEGLSASLIAAEILREIEANVAMAESVEGEWSAPPVCLSLADFRERYDVTMPDRLWLAFNILSQRRTPAEVFALFETAVAAAMERAIARYAALAAAFPDAPPAVYPPKVLTFAALRDLAAARPDTAAGGPMPPDGDDDNPFAATPPLVDALARRTGIEGPVVVIGFAGLHYPAVHLDPDVLEDRRLQAAARAAADEIGAEYGCSIGLRHYFSGISDMSFLGHRAAGLDLIAANTPSPAFVDRPAADLLTFPVINIGPWGREFHQKLERLHTGYGFSVLPALIERTVHHLFQTNDDG
ncbi:M20/M25/M40 family metallo-hydrolase [Aurantimonas sp. VKM B-3413]|uniref:M20/M25/M40 family metallo-hydrolase n=1 Tax=Aurantimonas sp. VKM B-3413 TaxID=2779401 RepID=UPI001E3EC184|nr:M20/M25/M40 family metallo-hydrolase [Aurantimonas sp. VKM B-3413]MCB8836440.1 M20/M25/M40 family metallo-hydrolase [Aurantimonas sp. VKM B-3413]